MDDMDDNCQEDDYWDDHDPSDWDQLIAGVRLGMTKTLYYDDGDVMRAHEPASAYHTLDNNGQLCLDVETAERLRGLGYVTIGEWLYHPEHWRLAVCNEPDDTYVSMGLDIELVPLTIAAARSEVERGICDWSDIPRSIRPSEMFTR